MSDYDKELKNLTTMISWRITYQLCATYIQYTRVDPKVSGLAAWSENCKWYSSLPLGAAVSIFCESL
jgi:hypothetical protein